MASSSAIRAGRAFVEIFLKDERLQKGLVAAERRLKSFAAGASQIGSRLLAVGAAMAAPLVGGTKVFVEFEQAMANVSTMLDQPERHMESFRAGVRKLSVEMGESTGTLAKGLYDILSASVAPEKAMYVLEVSARAAKAGLTDTGVAADAITTILNSYGLSAEQAGDVSDWLFTVVKRGKTTFAELAPQIGLVASTASAAGVGLDELGAMIALLTRNGVRTENAITAVNQVISQFLKPAAEAQAYAASLGFELSSATLKAEGLAGVFQRIASLPPDAVAKLFPDIRALRGAIPALAHIGELTEDLAAMQARGGNAAAAYARNAATLGTKLNQAKQAILQAAEAIGEALAPMLTDLSKWVVANAQEWADWIRQHKDTIVTVAKVAAGFLIAGGALKVLGAAAALAILPLKTLHGAVVGLTVYGPMLASGLSAAAKGIAALAVAHPVVAALVALAAAGTAVYLALHKSAASFREASDAAARHRESVVAQGQEGQKLIDRLADLNQKQRLSDDEMSEAARIIVELRNTYGDLGIRIDQTTGKIIGLTKAQNDLTAANARAEKVAVGNQIKALEAEFAANAKQTNVGVLKKAVGLLVRPISGWGNSQEEAAYARMDEISKELLALQAKADALDEIGNGTSPSPRRGASAGRPGGAAPASPQDLYAKSNQKLLDDIRKLELQRIGNSLTREVELTKLAYEEKIRAAKEAGQDISLVQRAMGLELQEIQLKHGEEERNLWFEIAEARIEATLSGGAREQKLLDLQLKQRREQLRKQGFAEAQIAAAEQAARDKAARDRRERDQSITDEAARARLEAAGGAGVNQKLFDFDLKARSDELRKQGVSEEAIRAREAAEREKFAKQQADREREIALQGRKDEINATMRGPAKELALFRLEQAEKIRRMQEEGVNPDLIRRSTMAASASFAAEHLQRKETTAGTFSAIAAVRGLGGVDSQEKTARNTEKMARLLEMFVGAARNNRLVFRQ